jgi:hypothetical protein
MNDVIRPPAVVLPDEAIVPGQNRIVPAPNQFTHELTRPQPYFYIDARQEKAPDGELATGTRVVLLVHDGGPYCRVADERGLYVETAYDGLKALP